MITWLKLHHDVLNDIKLRRFTAQEKWAWVALLVLASQNKDRGFISADDEDIADACEFNTTQDWLYYRDKLVAKGMVEFSASGLQIVHWESRQHEKLSDKPEATRERKRRQRAKQKDIDQDVSRDVTPQSRHSHATVTKCHALDTELDPELDPDPDPKTSLSPKGSPSPNPEEREGSHLLKEPEPTANEPDYAPQPIAPINGSNPKPQGAAPPVPPVEKPLPPWRLSWAADDYDPGFCEDVLKRMQKQWPERTLGDAIARIYNAEQAGQLKKLEADYSAYCDRKLIPPQLPQPIAQPLPDPSQREAAKDCLPQDLSEAIAAIKAKLLQLSWTPQEAARWMKAAGHWSCQYGATKMLYEGRADRFSCLGDGEIFDLLETLEPLRPGQCSPTLQPA